MNQSTELFCVSTNFRPVPYSGQNQPIKIGTKHEVQNWIDSFFKDIYGPKPGRKA